MNAKSEVDNNSIFCFTRLFSMTEEDNGVTTPPFKLPEDLGRLLVESPPVIVASSSSLMYVHPRVSIASTGVKHGRGLVARSGDGSDTIRAGEILFVTPPTVEAPIDAVLRVYRSKAQSGVSLEDVAETILLKEMKRCLRRSNNSDAMAAKAASFVALQDHHEEDISLPPPSIPVLNGADGKDEAQKILNRTKACHLQDEKLQGIIRQNAFGPDFHHYGRMQQELVSGSGSCYRRILGMYPLAAMINHSCQTNATRTFLTTNVNSENANCTEVNLMIATATQDILPGEEITWSYIPPTTNFFARREALRHYGFVCGCERCQQDENESEGLTGEKETTIQEYQNLLEEKYFSIDSNGIDVNMPFSICLAFTNEFIGKFNEKLSSIATNDVTIHQNVLFEASKLHEAFSRLHKSSTEHISIVHLCYDLATQLKSRGYDTDGIDDCITSTVYWMEQLKDLHRCRYSGNAVGDLPTLRKLLQHTKLVLRTRQGWQQATYRFI